MYVRLAFAVAAHLESEILIVDEVLAVGDAELQKKCLGKMGEVSKGEGRTVLFVSHNMEAVQKLCSSGIMLHQGKLIEKGTIESVITRYLEAHQNTQSHFLIPAPDNIDKIPAFAHELIIENTAGREVAEVSIGEAWRVRIRFRVQSEIENFIIALGLSSHLDMPIQTTWSRPVNLKRGDYEVVFSNNEMFFAEGHYRLVVGLSSNGDVIQYNEGVGVLSISAVTMLPEDTTIVNTKSGLIINQLHTDIIKLN
jgi:translation initiation factor RLI1